MGGGNFCSDTSESKLLQPDCIMAGPLPTPTATKNYVQPVRPIRRLANSLPFTDAALRTALIKPAKHLPRSQSFGEVLRNPPSQDLQVDPASGSGPAIRKEQYHVAEGREKPGRPSSLLIPTCSLVNGEAHVRPP